MVTKMQRIIELGNELSVSFIWHEKMSHVKLVGDTKWYTLNQMNRRLLHRRTRQRAKCSAHDKLVTGLSVVLEKEFRGPACVEDFEDAINEYLTKNNLVIKERTKRGIKL